MTADVRECHYTTSAGVCKAQKRAKIGKQSMKICFIACEYNPLHSGHVYQLSRARNESGADAVVCVMSGNAVQRGELAVAEKYARAEWAIRAGADLVVESDAAYATASAQGFACGVIRAASAFECERSLLFGTENGDLQALVRIANLLTEEPPLLQKFLKEHLDAGIGYAAALHRAADAYARSQGWEQNVCDALRNPNEILAIEYLREIRRQNAQIRPIAMRRIGDGYASDAARGEHASASALRQAHIRENQAVLQRYLPEYVLRTLPPPISQYALGALVRCAVGRCKDMHAISGIKEGLDRRIARACRQFADYPSLVRAIGTSRYSDATVRRALLAILSDNRIDARQLLDRIPDHLNILAVRENKRDLLALACIPIATTATRQARYAQAACTIAIDNVYRALAPVGKQQMRVIRID